MRKRPLNKKGLARNEEDIIETVSNSLVVHETKLKVDLTEHLEQHEFVFDAVLKEEVSNDELSAYWWIKEAYITRHGFPRMIVFFSLT